MGAGHDVALVVSQPDRRRGRGPATTPSPVKAAAVELGLPVTDRVDDVAAAGVDLGVVVAFGRLVRPHVLAAVPMVNLHYSLLPRWRGAAPVERAILAGDDTTGVCLMALEEGLDTGGVHARATLPLGPRATAAEVVDQLTTLGTDLLLTALDEGLGEPSPQVGPVTYAAKLTAEDRHLDWSRAAEHLDRVVRVGGAWTTFRGRRLKVHEAEPEPGAGPGGPPGTLEPATAVVATGGGGLRLLTVQPEGRAVVAAAAWVRGARLAPGEGLGRSPAPPSGPGGHPASDHPAPLREEPGPGTGRP